jgi:hypothetical protein
LERAKAGRAGKLEMAEAIAGAVAALALVGGSLALAVGVFNGDSATPVPADTAAREDEPPALVASTPLPLPAVTPTPTPAPVPAVVAGLAEGVEPPPPVVPFPSNDGVSPDLLALRDDLAAAIDAYRDQVGRIDAAVAITDLQTGETISVGGNEIHKTGCTMNMFALLAAVDAFQAGTANPRSVAYNINVGIGQSYPPQVFRLLANVFGSTQAGLDRANELMRQWGMKTSVYNNVPWFGDGKHYNWFTALEVNMILAKLYRGKLFDPEWTRYTLERLRAISWDLNYMLPSQLPASATVAHKIGFFWDRDGWVNNDAGLVTFTGDDGKEKAYTIVYLSQFARFESIGYKHAAQLSKIAWDYFDAKY